MYTDFDHFYCYAVLLKYPFVMTALCSDVKQTTGFFPGRLDSYCSSVVGAVDLCGCTELI